MSSTYPDWFEPTMPHRDACVLGPLLDVANRKHPDRVFALFEDGTQWTYAETREHTRSWARGLQQLGVRPGDSVLVWLPNRPEILNAWFAANYIGATYAPINTAYRGDLLSHVISNSGAKILIGHRDLLPRLADADLAQIEQVVCIGAVPDLSLPVPIHAAEILDADPDTLEPVPEVMPWDTAAIIYTSGTTGPSKGVQCSFFHFYNVGVLAVGFTQPTERCFINMPLFHIGAAGGTYGALASHASIGVVDGFSTHKFWDQIRTMNCATICGMVGSVVAFLSKREPSPLDKDNPLRRVLVAPVNELVIALAERHDFEYFTGFGMSEAPMPLISEMNPTLEGGYCGKARDGIECRIVDNNDIELPAGTVGELIIRSDHPWSMNHGYIKMPDATAKAWRNGWFHTGDAFRCDQEGRYFFVDRMKDAIRRRGENISSLEVEISVLEHPQVLDAAAIPVPAEHEEDEVMIVVEPKPNQVIDPAELTEFLIPRMAHFMVPRYVRIMATLPKTPTNKVQKPLLKKEGITADTWDREAAGIVLKRTKLD